MEEERWKRYWTISGKNGMLKEGDRVIAGVSGGADSICLLFLLDRYREALGISVEVVHMEHGIRGKETWRMRPLWKLLP